MICEAAVDPQPYLRRVVDSPLGRKFRQRAQTDFPLDVQLAAAIDRFSFSMGVRSEEANTLFRFQV